MSVHAVEPVGMNILAAPTISFKLNDRFNTDGLVLQLGNNDGSYSLVTDGYSTSCDGEVMDTEGSRDVNVSYGSFEKSYRVTVSRIPVTSVMLDEEDLAMSLHSTRQLAVSVQPADATDSSVIWSSDNASVASVSNTGFVTAISDGTAVITATAAGGALSASCTVTVTHTHSYTETVITTASCEKDGVVLYACSLCGAHYTDVIPATGHTYTETVVTPAFCENDGVVLFTCSLCDAHYTDTIPATGHHDADDDVICVICGEDLEPDKPECKCDCHSDSFFKRIFWKIVVIFWKLFNVEEKRACECGEMHW